MDRFLEDLRRFKYGAHHLDVRENIKFKGGYFSRWIHENFPNSVCSVAVEFKKFFMDEWTGMPDRKQLDQILLCLRSTAPGVLEELRKMGAEW